MRSAKTSTFFGQAWLIINPLLLAAVYYILVTIIRRKRDSIVYGVYGVLPLLASSAGLLRLPHDLSDGVWAPKMLLSLYFVGTMVVFDGIGGLLCYASGLLSDTSTFLPFFVRIWLYLSSILWAPTHRRPTLWIDHGTNPAQPDVFRDRRLHRLLQSDAFPPTYMWISSAVWGLVAAVMDSSTSFRGSVSLLSALSNGELPLAVRVNDLSITYRTTFERKPTLKQALIRFGRGQRAVKEIEAIKNVSFEVRTGTAMGIIGSNGSGKSTLMRAMAGILPPTSGSIEVWGRASTLLALGVGFNHDLSGRENIILGGLASGLSRRDVEERADEVAEWTELGDFIDMPMQTYSSGMSARVGFSVAVHMKPDILMIDEALSTGDAHFREKATAKMAELRESARAMFVVSHGLDSIKEMCNEAMWLDRGKLMMRGEPADVVDAYMKFVKVKKSASNLEDM